MRHNVYGRKLGRDIDQRQALFKNLLRSLILHQKIETTEAKAKAIKGLVDKVINQAKSPATRRLLSQLLPDTKVQEKLIKELVPLLHSRNSGYTTMVRLGRRVGDGTMMVQMKLLTETPQPEEKEKPKKRQKKEDK